MIESSAFVIFDCDGVILDSNHIKSNAFREVIQHESKSAIQAFIDFHERNGGVSRFEKFNWFYRDFLKRQDWQEASKQASEKFGDVVKANLLTASFVPGAMELLQKLKSQNTLCFVVSGGAHDEVNWLLKKREVAHYFKAILGSPKTKIEILASLKQNHGLNGQGVFLGDAESDLEAAEHFGLRFIFVRGYSLWKAGEATCKEKNYNIVEDLTRL